MLKDDKRTFNKVWHVIVMLLVCGMKGLWMSPKIHVFFWWWVDGTIATNSVVMTRVFEIDIATSYRGGETLQYIYIYICFFSV